MSFGIHHGMDVEKATRNRCNKAVASYFILKQSQCVKGLFVRQNYVMLFVVWVTK